MIPALRVLDRTTLSITGAATTPVKYEGEEEGERGENVPERPLKLDP